MAQKKGYCPSKETREKISKAMRGTCHMSEEGKQRMILSKQKKVQLGKRVYDSLQSAAEAIGDSPINLSRAIKNGWSIPVKFTDK